MAALLPNSGANLPAIIVLINHLILTLLFNNNI